MPWDELEVDVLIDSSGISKNLEKASLLKGKINQVIVTNSPDEKLVDKT